MVVYLFIVLAFFFWRLFCVEQHYSALSTREGSLFILTSVQNSVIC